MSRPEYLEHVAGPGDRWDLIAKRYYGDAKNIKPLLLANPAFTGDPASPAPLALKRGDLIRVPVIDEAEEVSLPPWKR